MRVSKKGVALIKEYEGLRLKAYRDLVGVWTIGYGHTKGVYPGQVIDSDLADKFLMDDIWNFEECINHLVKVPLNQGQFDALVSFSFNLGQTALENSTLLKLLNSGDYDSASHQFERWVRANGVVTSGLVRRRKAEVELWVG